jgi:hypothetical protein
MQFLKTNAETYAYRRIGSGHRRPLQRFQDFTGTLDNCEGNAGQPTEPE